MRREAPPTSLPRVWPSLSLPTGIALTALAAASLVGWALAGEQWQILTLLFLVGVVPVTIRWPVISAFGAYAFLVPFDSVTALGSGTLTKLVGMLAATVLLSAALLERRLSRPPQAALWWALLLLWAAMTSAWAIIDPSRVINGLVTPISLFLLYLVAVSIRVSEKELGWVCSLTVLGATLAAGWGVLYGIEDAYDKSARGTLMVGEQAAGINTFAASLIPPLALAMGSFIGLRSRVGKVFSVAAVGVISAGIYLTMSRGALVGVGAMAVVFLYRFRVRWQVLLVVCLLIGVAATMPATFLDRILAVGNDDATGSGRTKIWAIGIEALASHGLVGAGFRSFLDVYSQTVPIPPSLGAKAAHNMYLGAWVELGVVGLALLLGALACHLLAARRARSTKGSDTTITMRAAEAALYGLLATGLFNDLLWRKFFWLPLILLVWAAQAREQEQASKPVVAQREPAHP